MGLTLCMIVKNEAANIARCVESVRHVVDEIVIVDTGSSDGTIDIAKSLGASVHPYEWIDDFSAARNEALKYVRTEWVISIDADEMISAKDHSKIITLTGDENIDGYFLTQRHYLPGTGYDRWRAARGDYPEMERGYPGYTENYSMRLFRSRPDIRYEGRVHENVVCGNPSGRWVTSRTDIVIHHYGKVGDPETLDRKKTAYLELGLKKAQERPDDPKAQYELGLQLNELGRFEECIGPFERSYKLDNAYSSALYYIGNVHYKFGRLKEARSYLARAIESDPSDADAWVNLAGVERQEGDMDKALDCFDKAIHAQEDFFAAWFNKGALLLSSGKSGEAEPCFERALELIPDYTQAMFGKWQSLLLQGKLSQAGEEMVKWMKDYPELEGMVMTAVNNFLESRNYLLTGDALAPLVESIDNTGGYAAMGAALLGLNNIEEAERHLEKALELDEKNNDARVNLAQLKELHRSDNKAAMALYEAALKLEPHNYLCLQRLSALRSS